jgi:hypothetical protein
MAIFGGWPLAARAFPSTPEAAAAGLEFLNTK